MEEENKYYTFSVIKRIWKNYASGSLKLLLIALFCNAIVALTTPALPELIRRVIDDIFVNSNREMLTILPCLLYTSPSPRDQRGSRMPSSA